LFEVGERGEWNEDGIGLRVIMMRVRVWIIGSSEKSEREKKEESECDECKLFSE
jgi:hypothetical protein